MNLFRIIFSKTFLLVLVFISLLLLGVFLLTKTGGSATPSSPLSQTISSPIPPPFVPPVPTVTIDGNSNLPQILSTLSPADPTADIQRLTQITGQL